MDKVTLQEILESRENRVMRQQQLINEYCGTLVNFMLNIPGEIKVFDLAQDAFEEGLGFIRNQVMSSGYHIIAEEQKYLNTGYEAYFMVSAEPVTTKKIMVEIEEDEMMGRLFDIDVLREDGSKVSREEVGLSVRKCMICDDVVGVCARSGKHTAEELKLKTISIMKEYFDNKLVEEIAAYCVKALLYEVNITPKPGLVDRNNNGAHDDMNTFTFIDSSTALISYFKQATKKGLLYKGKPEDALCSLRYIGKKAEAEMFRCTGGVNTHKGLIFSLGILCFAIGYQYSIGKLDSIDWVLETGRRISSAALDDFNDVTLENANTAGEKLYAKYGIMGIRGEAASGFETVREHALPLLSELLASRLPFNDAAIVTLFNLIANTQDTNIITRSSIEKQESTRNCFKDVIENSKMTVQDLIETAERLDDEFIDEHISPGGSADLLAVTFFLYFVQSEIIYKDCNY